MAVDKELIKKINGDIDFIHMVLNTDKGKLGVFEASEEYGILPHQIAEGSLIFVDREEKYKKGDYIIITEKRNGKKSYRITKAWCENEKNYFGRILMTTKRFVSE